MKSKLFLICLFLSLITMSIYILACKKDKGSDPANAEMKPISVSFSRDEILNLLSNTGSNEVAGICFVPVQDGEKINLKAILAEWNTSESKPNEMIKVMNKKVAGTITNDQCPSLAENGTSEFELVFYDKETLLRFLNDDHFYPNKTQKSAGLYFSRIMLDLSDGSEYKKYRGLVMKPYPLPDYSKGFAEREGTGYEIGPACPPRWRNE